MEDGGSSHSPPSSPITSDDSDAGLSDDAAPYHRARARPNVSFFCEALSVKEPHHHFLDSCSLCKKPLGDNCDIFMYGGDTPFCSVECRQEQIDMDEDTETLNKLSSSLKKQHHHYHNQKSNVAARSSESQKFHVRAAGAVVAR